GNDIRQQLAVEGHIWPKRILKQYFGLAIGYNQPLQRVLERRARTAVRRREVSGVKALAIGRPYRREVSLVRVNAVQYELEIIRCAAVGARAAIDRQQIQAGIAKLNLVGGGRRRVGERNTLSAGRYATR